MKRNVFAYVSTCMNNELMTDEFSMGGDGHFDTNESWTKVCGPWFTYMNSVPTSYGTTQAAQALFQDAQAQDAAEKAAWPYPWFQNAAYAPAAGRGTVTGRIYIADRTNNLTNAGGLWVGLIQQPFTYFGTSPTPTPTAASHSRSKAPTISRSGRSRTRLGQDRPLRQLHLLPHPRRTELHPLRLRTGRRGHLRVPHPHDGPQRGPDTPPPATSNQTLPPLECDLPTVQPTGLPAQASPVPRQRHRRRDHRPGDCNVDADPLYGATVFEIGQNPTGTPAEFRHGEDAWAPQMPRPTSGFPTPVWGGRGSTSRREFPAGSTTPWAAATGPPDWNNILPSYPNTSTIPARPGRSTSSGAGPHQRRDGFDLPGLRQRQRGRRRDQRQRHRS